MAPIADVLADRELLVVPDGPLYLLPFAALLTALPGSADQATALPYLIRDHAISYAQSASVAGLLVTEATAVSPAYALHLAAYADPSARPGAAAAAQPTAARVQAERIARACPRIPFTANEVWEVADLAADDGLTLEQPDSYDGGGGSGSARVPPPPSGHHCADRESTSARFLHLATHGIVDARRPQIQRPAVFRRARGFRRSDVARPSRS